MGDGRTLDPVSHPVGCLVADKDTMCNKGDNVRRTCWNSFMRAIQAKLLFARLCK